MALWRPLVLLAAQTTASASTSAHPDPPRRPLTPPTHHGGAAAFMAKEQLPPSTPHAVRVRHQRLTERQRRRHGPPDPAACPAPMREQAAAHGYLSVAAFGAHGNSSGAWAPGATDDSGAVRAAMAMARACGGVDVFFPQGGYSFKTTVSVLDSSSLVGEGAGGHAQFMDTEMPTLFGPAQGPALFYNGTEGGSSLRNMNVVGQECAVKMLNVALIRFTDVSLSARSNTDNVDPRLPGANVVLGSNNAALVIENAFWLWFERMAIEFLYLSPMPAPWPQFYGQRPSVIIRGADPELVGVTNAYLIVFKDMVFSGGAVQYQQTAECPGCGTGYFDFFNCVQESSALPLLDIQSDPSLEAFFGLEAITVIDYMDADSLPPHYAEFDGNLTSVIHLNCSQPMCTLDGVTMMGAAAYGEAYNSFHVGPAVRVFAGKVRSVTLLDSSHLGAVSVVDRNGVPTGSFVAKTGGGLILLGYDTTSKDEHDPDDATLIVSHVSPNSPSWPANNRTSDHGLLLGLSGETTGRLAIDCDGSIRWGAGNGAAFDSTLQRQISRTAEWDPAALDSGSPMANITVPVPGASAGDIVTAAHTGVSLDHPVQLVATADNSKVGVRMVLLGSDGTDVPAGVLRVTVQKWA